MKIRLFASLRERIGQKELEITKEEAKTVQKLIELLIRRYPEAEDLLVRDGELSSFYHILINGKNITLLDGTKTIFNEDDTVAILPPIGGGI
ncbi:MAG: ubiquitin-like small modifier protein 1 [Candidatus Hodarchaeota archaeon]